MSSEELLYTKGAKIWIPHPTEVWESATLEENYKKGNTIIKLQLDTGRLLELNVKTDGSDLPPLRNPSILIGQNDLTALSYLHEPGVLHNLKVRFCERQIIYTYCGIVLVAINPYAELPLYGPSIIRAYRGRSMGEMEPHIFALSEEAYAKLEREKCNLSIIVSGESGAGKTVSAKYAMRYFAAVGGSESETQVERKVLASSPIMEAFGNAKTTRNDNSSRFGKFTKLLFKDSMSVMNLTGATMHTYLLEKSRVVFQAPGERNYHIFYQLCSTRDKYPELILDHQDKFTYLNQGRSPDIDKISDKGQFIETIQAMNVLGFSTNQIGDILKILSGILHLGNIKFVQKIKNGSEEIDPDGCDIFHDDLNLRMAGEMLKVNSDELRKWLICRQIASVNEQVLIPNNMEIAQTAKDALAKHIYLKLFQYIVSVINKCLNTGSRKQNNFIGVLDIYGFETFEINSFEQFCINYANEKLQQQFNQHVFKLEQEEYLKEGITWTMIDFYDNQPCIDLIESKLGVLDLLDEECRMPRGSDESWAGKLIAKCIKFPHFDKPRFGTTSFSIKHFSDSVEYDVHGFLEKNRDTVSKELVNVVRHSSMPLCKQLIDLEEIDTLSIEPNEKTYTLGGRVLITPAKTQVQPSKQHRQSVGSQFRESLASLIATLHSTTPHYVRCIKPNDDKIAFKWETSKIVQQLRACGVLETVRISAAGFPSRWSYHDFYMRYQLLCHRSMVNKNDIKQSCQNIVTKWITEEEKYRFGNTQIFFRAGQVAYLEQVRSNLRKKYITIIQSVVRRFICQKRYKRLKQAAVGIQRHGRGLLARRKLQQLREERAAIVIAKYARGWLCRRRFLKLRRSILGIQQYARGLLARKHFNEALDNHRAIQIQRFIRGYLARRIYHKKRHQIVICQAAVRRFLARRQFKRMKAEAKTITHIQMMYKGLENKIISLQQRIDDLNRENNNLKLKNSEISVLRLKLEGRKSLESKLKTLTSSIEEYKHMLDNLKTQLETERDEKMQLLQEKHINQEEWATQKQVWLKENDELRQQIEAMIEQAKNTEILAKEQRDRYISEVETNEIHEAYQRAVKEKEIMENENSQLKEELSRYQKNDSNENSKRHLRSMSNVSSYIEDDIGYVSAKGTLDTQHRHRNMESIKSFSSSMENGNTCLILKLRNILEEEKKRNKSLREQVEKLQNRNKITEDSIRVSELEVENEKLQHDYELLRSSIQHNTEIKVFSAQFNALKEEVHRRREECIQLKAVLQQQSQSFKHIGTNNMIIRNDAKNVPNNELMEAFQAQKLANKQLEMELSAMTEENNARLANLTRENEEYRRKSEELTDILNNGLKATEEEEITDAKVLLQNERYLRYELEKALYSCADTQEELNILYKKHENLQHNHSKMALKCSNTNIDSTTSTHNNNNINNNAINSNNRTTLASVGKQKTHFDGVMKFHGGDLDPILKRLVIDMTEKIAIGLLPGFPAYIIFMCIRYTDMINAEDDVQKLLGKFIVLLKKIHKTPQTTEIRTLWLVNSITLLNLLKQYGDVEDYVKFNTERQNQQQLKNFNLYEYRRIILEIILRIYESLVLQIQDLIEQHVVPALLDNDEIQRGRHTHGMRARIVHDNITNTNISPEHTDVAAWKKLINALDFYYRQFQDFGLNICYAEQIIMQLLYFICAVAMNCLMLRGDICMWETGMIIRYNIGYIEDWVRERKMSSDVLTPLSPLNQVSQLLQSRKSEEDVQSICDLCTNLNTAQVLKIMKSYKLDDYENEITNKFLEKLTEKLNERPQTKNNEFTMDQKFIHPFKVVFKYSDIKLEDIELPRHLHLDDLLAKI